MTAKRKGKASEGKAAMAYMRRLHGDPATAPAVRGQQGMSALLNLCAKLTSSQVSTSDKALEIELDEGGRVFFIRSGEHGVCACGITDDAAPDMKKELDTELASRGLPLFIIDPEIENRPPDPSEQDLDNEASDGIEELARLSDLPLRQWRPACTRIITWPEGKPITPLKKKKNNTKRRQAQ